MLQPFAKAKLGLLVGLLSVSISSAASAQRFNLDRLEAGQAAHAAGDFKEAIVEFDLACFGMVNDPVEYARCKALLFLSQVADRQLPAAKATLLLIARIEERQRAYSNAPLQPEQRQQFESTVIATFADERFTQTPRFYVLIEQARDTKAAMEPPPIAREMTVAELRARVAADPLDLGALEQLADRLYRNEKVVDAQQVAETLAATEPTNVTAQCIQATTRAARNRSLCTRYLPDMELCPDGLHTALYIKTRLRCHTDLESYNEGRDFLATLDPTERAGAKIESLARKINNRATAEGASGEPNDQLAAAGSEEVSPELTEPDNPAEVAALPTPIKIEEPTPHEQPEADPAVLQRLARLRRDGLQAANGGDRARLDGIFEQVRAVTTQHPEVLEAQRIAGEFAFLLSHWSITIEYLAPVQRLGAASATEAFYLAAAYHEVGEAELAQEALEDSLQRGVVRTSVVDSYEKKILGRAP